MSKPLYYFDYLQLDKLLNLQALESEKAGQVVPDEHLFIVTHQAFELWFKQILVELDLVLAKFEGDFISDADLAFCISRIERVIEILKLVVKQFDVLKSMTSMDFLEFRDHLIPASGFQSVQFRVLENKLGVRRRDVKSYLQCFSKQHQNQIQAAENQSSLFDVVEAWLKRIPYLNTEDYEFWGEYQQAVKTMLDHDEKVIHENPILDSQKRKYQLKQLNNTRENFSAIFNEEKYQDYLESGEVRIDHKALKAALFIILYREQKYLSSPYRLLTLLVDLDECLSQWRYQHLLIVQRMIGNKIGTGGSSGLNYLRSTLERLKVFNDLTNLSTYLIPRSALPDINVEDCIL